METEIKEMHRPVSTPEWQVYTEKERKRKEKKRKEEKWLSLYQKRNGGYQG
jgi:hypothetical protein